AQPDATARGIGVAADDELLALQGANFSPRGRAPALVRRIAPLRHDPLHPELRRLAEECGAVALDVIGVADRVLRTGARDQRLERVLPRQERQLPQIAAVQVRGVEYDVFHAVVG